jgi:hypothetical protein
MRIFPLVLIAVGVFGLLEHFGLIDPAFIRLFWPLLLIAIGVALLSRPRWRADMSERMQHRWERRMHRHFGPGWANLSEAERERFRAGMRQWRPHSRGDEVGRPPAPAAASEGSFPTSPARPSTPDEHR